MQDKGFSYRYSAGDQAEEDVLRRRYRLSAGTEISTGLRAAPVKERREAVLATCLLALLHTAIFGGGIYLFLASFSSLTWLAGLLLALTGLGGLMIVPYLYRRIIEHRRRRNAARFTAGAGAPRR